MRACEWVCVCIYMSDWNIRQTLFTHNNIKVLALFSLWTQNWCTFWNFYRLNVQMNTYLLGGVATSVIRITPISRLTFSFAFVYSVVGVCVVFFFICPPLFHFICFIFLHYSGNIVIFAFMALSSVYCECAPVWIFAPHTIYSMKCVYILKYGSHHEVNMCILCILEFRMFLLLAGHFFSSHLSLSLLSL